MMNWLKNIFKFYGARLAFVDLQNWFYVMKVIRKHKNTADWKVHNLRADWVGRVYTVINPQSPTDDGDSMEILKIKYAERLKPINLYLDKLGLSYSITVAYDQLPESKSFLIVYVPIFAYLTVLKVFWWLTLIATFFLTKLDTWTWNGISYLWDLLMKLF
jgi:hypothetical protein